MPASDALKQKIAQILRESFPENSAISVTDGYADNIHVVVVSDQFDDLSEKEKQDKLWSAIDRSSLSEAEKTRISLILPYSPLNLK